MGSATNLYGDLSPLNAGYVAKRTLERSNPEQVLEPFVSGKTLPSNQTKTITFKRFTGDINFAKTNAYLSEGITPVSQAVTVTDYTLTLRQMGGLMGLTDVIDDTHPNMVATEMFDILGEQAPRIVETDRYYALRAGTNKYYSGSATSRATVVAVVASSLLDKLSRVLRQNVALVISRMAKTTPDFNTVAVRPAYIIACHSDLEYDVEALPGFKSIENYPQGTELLVGEIGSYKNFRFVISQDLVPYPDAGAAVAGTVSTSGVNSDVYPLIIFGQRAWDSVAFKGRYAVTPTAINPVPSKSDPLGQRGSVGWKTMQGSIITNQSWMIVAEVACTSL
jgi:N4-gp56 family major capsid protein